MNQPFLQSKAFRITVAVIVLLVVAFLSFRVGILVGYSKARFSYAWGENYDRNFGGPHHGIFGFFSGGGFMNAHGTFGLVVGVNAASSTLVVSGADKLEKTVLIASSTVLRKQRNDIGLSDIKANDPVIVIGSPNDAGQIEARFIRVLW